MRCKLTRIRSTNRNLRTDEIVGGCSFKPTEGSSFVMAAEPLNPSAHVRVIETTPIVTLIASEGEKVIEFQTRNTLYRWERLENAADPGTQV